MTLVGLLVSAYIGNELTMGTEPLETFATLPKNKVFVGS